MTQDFPPRMLPVYLDHNATTPLDPEAARAMTAVLHGPPANPSSLHSFGRSARAAVDRARRAVAQLVGGVPGDVLFTSSGTESIATTFRGYGPALARDAHLPHLVLSTIEHAASIDAARALERDGWEITWVPVEASGIVDPRAVARAVRPTTALVSVLHANNETGVVQPVEAIARVCRERGVALHVDVVQSAGKIPVTASAWSADFVSIAAHKMGGPQGVGALWVRGELKPVAVIPGLQEAGRRGGTLNVAGIVGMGCAAERALAGLATYAARVLPLRERLETAMARVPGARLTAAASPRLPNTSHFTFPEADHPDLVMALDLAGYAVSAGAACRSGSTEPSHVLTAMGMSAGQARTALRVSLGLSTTAEAIDGFVDAVAGIVARASVPQGRA